MDGNRAGQARRMGSSSPPRMVLSCFIPVPARMTRKTFSPHPCLLGPSEAPPHLVKLYFLLICPTTSTIFFNETYFIYKNILEITTKFIPLNQINFQKNLNNISTCLTRQPFKKKKKTHSITHNKIKAENYIWQNKIS